MFSILTVKAIEKLKKVRKIFDKEINIRLKSSSQQKKLQKTFQIYL